MTILEIPVSIFTKRILEAENEVIYPPDSPQCPVILLKQNDLLFKHICIKPLGASQVSLEARKTLLPEMVKIQVHDKLAKAVHKNTPTVGLYLNDLHRADLCKTIWWETRGLHLDNAKCSLEAKAVIDRYCERFNIELDIDINYETLYKSWTRYKKRIEASRRLDEKRAVFFQKKKPHPVRGFSEKKYRNITLTLPNNLSNEDLEKVAQNYIDKNPTLFHTKYGKTIRPKRLSACRVFVYYQIGQRTMADIAKTVQLSQKNCYDQLAAFRLLLRKAPFE